MAPLKREAPFKNPKIYLRPTGFYPNHQQLVFFQSFLLVWVLFLLDILFTGDMGSAQVVVFLARVPE
jgi:hypothetical protein